MDIESYFESNRRPLPGILFVMIVSVLMILLSTQTSALTISQVPKTMVSTPGVGTIPWLTPTNANLSDNNYATSALAKSEQSYYLNVSNFGFSIPVGSTINGITVYIERSGSSNNRITDTILRLTKNGNITGNNYAAAGGWTTTDTLITYGSATDLWGQNWTYSDINSANFGLVLSVTASNPATARVDLINVSVNYTPPAANLVVYVYPTPQNNSVMYTDMVYINVTTNFVATPCQLNWSGTLYAMSGSGTNWYYNMGSLPPGSYVYNVRCNDTQGYTNTTFRNVSVARYPNISYISPTYPNSWSTQDPYAYVNTTAGGSHIGSAFIDWNYTQVLWLRFNNESGGTNTVFKDSTSYENNATCIGAACPSYTDGARGLALYFDRTNNELNISDHYSLNPPSAITIMAWFKISGNSGTNRYIISKPSGASWTAPYATYAIRLDTSNNLQFWINDGSLGADIVTSTTAYPADNTWRHLAATFNGTEERLYVNGVLVGTNSLTAAITTSTQQLYIASTGRTTTERWNGSLDDVQIFSRALSDYEINATYDASVNRLSANFTKLSVGDYYYTAYIQDMFGSINSTEARLFTVTAVPPDNTRPNVSLMSPPDGNQTQNSTRLFMCNITDDVQVYNLSLYIWNSTGNQINTGDAWCYQETANVTAGCGDVGNGSYSVAGSWTTPENGYDGLWSTSAVGGSSPANYVYMTYTKPSNALNTSVWQVKDSVSTRNVTIPDACFTQGPTLLFRAQASSSGNYVNWQCDSGGGTWQTIATDGTGNIVYEEGMYWDLNMSTQAAFVNGTENQTSWLFTFPFTGLFYWSCLGYDTSSNGAFAPSNYSVELLPQNAPPSILDISITDGIAPENQIVLLAGGTRNVSCLVTAMDFNGASSLTNASATLYYHMNRSSDPDDGNVHYTDTNCSLNETTATNKTFSCDFQVYYYANNGTWNCTATVFDDTGLNTTGMSNTTFDPLYALNITDGLSFGNTEPNVESSEITANITNIGNMPINITLQGYAVFIGDNTAMNCSDGSSISIDRERYNLTSGTYSSKNPLTGGLEQLPLTMPKPTSSSAVSSTTYWQIMPNPEPGVLARNCSGYVIFTAEVS